MTPGPIGHNDYAEDLANSGNRLGRGPDHLTDREQRQMRELQQHFESNRHEVYGMDSRLMLELWKEQALAEGATEEEARQTLLDKLLEWDLKEAWEQIRAAPEFAAKWTSTTMDSVLLAKLAQDMNAGGSIISTYRINEYNGRQYIIFKGSQKLRKLVTGTRYLVNNTKIVQLGIGKLGAARTVVAGMRLTLILTVAFRSVDTLMRDEATWHDFVGGLATDLVKTSIAGGAALIGSALGATGAATGAFVLGPLFLAIAIGVGTGLVLEKLDERYGFTKSLIEGLREADRDIRAHAAEIKRQWNYYHRTPESTVDFWMRVFGAPPW